jgi:hypothetical protein
LVVGLIMCSFLVGGGIIAAIDARRICGFRAKLNDT